MKNNKDLDVQTLETKVKERTEMFIELMNDQLSDLDSSNKKKKDILNYCRPHIKQMWAATIVSIILNCEFRDAEAELKFYDKLHEDFEEL